MSLSLLLFVERMKRMERMESVFLKGRPIS
jgi:hypothetical protein